MSIDTDIQATLPCQLSGSLAWLMSATAHELNAHVSHALDELALSFRSFVVLSAIAGAPGNTQRQIGKSAGLDKTTLVAALDKLESEGYIERRLCQSDRRIRTLELTDNGLALYCKAQKKVQESEQESLAGLTDTQRNDLLALLETTATYLRQNPVSGSCV